MEKLRLVSGLEFVNPSSLNQLLLFFDRLGAGINPSHILKNQKAPFEEFQHPFYLRDRSLLVYEPWKSFEEILQPYRPNEPDPYKGRDSEQIIIDMQHSILRAERLTYSKKYDVSVPTDSFYKLLQSPSTKKDQVTNLILKKVPILTVDTEIERLIDFKKDPDSKIKLAALRNWMNEISYTQYTQNEIEDKMEYLLMQYQDHMDRAKLKYTLGSAEFWITAVPDIMNDLAHFKLGLAAKALFGFAKKELMLMEEERKAPGKELAFVYKAQQEFGG